MRIAAIDHLVLTVRDLQASVYCRDPDGNLLEISSYLAGEQAGAPAA
jgi:catechol 2,3-dioxygenase-like lactoylglutathione lyase family enzyme